MTSRWFNLLLVALALLLSAPLHAAWQSAVDGNLLGKRMPPLALVSAAGHGVDATGNGVLLVHFWAPGCVPCRQRMQLLDALQASYGPQGLTVIGMAREPPRALADVARRVPRNDAAVADPADALFAELGVRSIPYAILIDRNGIVVWQGDPSALRRTTLETTLDAPRLGALVRF